MSDVNLIFHLVKNSLENSLVTFLQRVLIVLKFYTFYKLIFPFVDVSKALSTIDITQERSIFRGKNSSASGIKKFSLYSSSIAVLYSYFGYSWVTAATITNQQNVLGISITPINSSKDATILIFLLLHLTNYEFCKTGCIPLTTLHVQEFDKHLFWCKFLSKLYTSIHLKSRWKLWFQNRKILGQVIFILLLDTVVQILD